MAEHQEIPSDIDNKVDKVSEENDQAIDKKIESEEAGSGSGSSDVTEDKTESEKATSNEEKSPEPMSPLTSDTTSGVEVKSDSDTPSGAEASAAVNVEPAAEGSSTASVVQGSSAMEAEISPSAAVSPSTEISPSAAVSPSTEISPTKKTKTSSFTGAIRKIISPRKKDRASDEDTALSPKEKTKGKSFLKNPLKSSKSMSPANKSMDASASLDRERPEAGDEAKGAVGGKAVSPTGISPTTKSGKKGLGSKIKKSISSLFKKGGIESEGLYMPEDAEVAAAEAAAAKETKPAEEEESSTPPPYPGKPGFPYWKEARLSLDEHPPSVCETQNTSDAQSQCSKFSDAFVPDWEMRRFSADVCIDEGASGGVASSYRMTPLEVVSQGVFGAVPTGSMVTGAAASKELPVEQDEPTASENSKPEGEPAQDVEQDGEPAQPTGRDVEQDGEPAQPTEQNAEPEGRPTAEPEREKDEPKSDEEKLAKDAR